MKVMWFSFNTNMQQHGGGTHGWVDALKRVLMLYYHNEIQLAVSYECEGEDEFKFTREGITYYPLKCPKGIFNKYVYTSFMNGSQKWKLLELSVLDAIKDYQPDIIQCFGSEWPYGAVANLALAPVVIHMQGFLNIYTYMGDILIGSSFVDKIRRLLIHNSLKNIIMKVLYYKLFSGAVISPIDFELQVMRANRYFMGRTEWDRNIVRYYSPGAQYYHVPEAIRSEIYKSAGKWKYRCSDKLRLLTITSGSELKGTEIILRTAKILKDVLGIDFSWRVAGRPDFFPFCEKRTGINHENVNVKVLNKIDMSQVIQELTEADFFIHPSIIDNSPNAICEAQLVGIPVIASNVGGVPQLVTDKKTGFLYPYNEPHTLAFLIGNLYKDQKLLKQVSNNETSMSLKRHEPRHVAETVMRTYEAILQDYKMRHASTVR